VHAGALGKELDGEEWSFQAKAFTGQSTPPPRWKTCLGATKRWMGDSLARAWVTGHFDASGKEEAIALVREIERSMQDDLGSLDWMDAPTRAAAIEKLHRIGNQIAFPDAWQGLGELTVDRRAFFAAELAAAEVEGRRVLGYLTRPTDRGAQSWRWMHPYNLDAMNDPQLQQLIFPAAVLVPPFFVRGAGAANVPQIGWVMGHELSHEFDANGRKFDERGVLRDWWSPGSATAFEERAQCFVDQYGAFEVLPGVHVDGKVSLVENIADNGGERLAWMAWKRGRAGKAPLPKVAGLDEDQQFFVSTAQGCAVGSEAYLRSQVTTDFHVWWKFRALGPAMNMPEFAEAFHCKAGAKMNPAKKCRVW
jgi:predicted metalloendopeptidase